LNTRNSTGCFYDSTGCFYQQWIKTTKTNIKEFRGRKNHTNSFIVVHSYTKSYIQFPKTSGYPLSNKKPDYKHTTTKEVILIPSRTHTSFGAPQSHHKSEHPLTLWTPVLTELQMKKEIGLITPGTNQIKVHQRNIQSLKQSWSKLDFTNWCCKVNARSVKQNIYTPISNWKHLL